MTPDQYLQQVLAAQTFDEQDPEMVNLRRSRDQIAAKLKAAFASSNPSLRWAGSRAKGTMIRASYDGDVTCYFDSDEAEAGSSLEELYESAYDALQDDYNLTRKSSAIRVKDPSTLGTRGFAEDLHVDVVPGRFIDASKTDVNLHQTSGNKRSLKTNLQTHIDHIRESGLIDAIKMAKLWNVTHGINAKTFVLELLVVKELARHKRASLSTQLQTLWERFRDDADDLAVEDPANPTGNDLTPALDSIRPALASVAHTTLQHVEAGNWEAVFGPLPTGVDEQARAAKQAALARAAAAAPTPTRPWLE